MRTITQENGTERNETRQEILARHDWANRNTVDQMAFLESIHQEEPYFQRIEAENARENRREFEHKRDLGLVTEVNTKTSCGDATEIMESITALFKRHQFGFKGGFHRTEDKSGYNRWLRLGKVEQAEDTELVDA